MAAVDLENFKPENLEQLLKGIVESITSVVTTNVKAFLKEVKAQLESLARKAWLLKEGLLLGTISLLDADIALHTQELALRNIVLFSKFMTYALAQDVLNAVFSVVTAAIKNLTGVGLIF